MNWLGWLLGLERVSSVDEVEPALAAAWAQEAPFVLFLGVAVLVAVAVIFYLRYQQRGSAAARTALAVCRALVLALLLITLADPVLQIKATHAPQPLLYLLFDGTDSMAIEDQFAQEESRQLKTAVGWKASGEQTADTRLSRMAYVQSLLGREEQNLLQRLQQEKQVRLEAYVFDGNTTSQLRKLNQVGDETSPVDPATIAAQLSTTGQVTALGAVMHDVSRQFGAGGVAGVVMFGDFAHNSGAPPLGSQTNEQSPLEKLGVPVYTVGVGATQAKDLAVDLQMPPRLRKGLETTLSVNLDQTGLDGETAKVTVVGHRLRGDAGLEGAETFVVGERTVALKSASETLQFPYKPREAGRVVLEARVEKHDAETVEQNNQQSREVNVIEDYMRLLYVAYEPDWEWRFIKEVFQKHPEVGMKGFRTYLVSSDPRVREQSELFQSTLNAKRGEFFNHDLIFIGDMPRSELSPRFCRMVKEFVQDFGGGVVFLAGPRFGPRELVGTELADLLPVVIDPRGKLRDDAEFLPQLTADAESGEFTFMQLAKTGPENRAAWRNMGKLPWYQPVERVVSHRRAAVLMQHPTDKCLDQKTPQPLIAMGSYGSRGGQVVYMGFNETWRLRREQGEKLYEPFWYQLMDRLSMSHALGEEKRFDVRTNMKECRVGDKITLTVEAYDANYERLTEDKIPNRVLQVEHTMPAGRGRPQRTVNLEVPMRTPGVFEIRLDVEDAGEHALRVKNPLTGAHTLRQFRAAALSAERRLAVRNVALQREIASATGGKSYDLNTVDQLVNDLRVERKTETSIRNHALWSTPLWFILVVTLLLGEWLCRKWIHLT